MIRRCWFAPLLLALWASSQMVERAHACDACRALGTTIYHSKSLEESVGTLQSVPEPYGADHYDDDAPDPQFADSSPGQYVLSGAQWPQPGGKGTPIMLTYSFQNMFNGDLRMPNGQPLPNSLIRGSIEEALGLWASAAPLHFREVFDNGLSYGTPGAQFGQLRFRQIRINGPDPPMGRPVAKAQAYFPSIFGDLPGDVDFDNGDLWQEVGTLRQPDILGAAIHEIGHTLGLGHSLGVLPGEYWTYQRDVGGGQLIDVFEPKGNANMFWIFMRYSGLGSGQLYDDDIAGIQAIYGAGQGSVTSLVPEPATWIVFVIGFGPVGWRRTTRRRN